MRSSTNSHSAAVQSLLTQVSSTSGSGSGSPLGTGGRQVPITPLSINTGAGNSPATTALPVLSLGRRATGGYNSTSSSSAVAHRDSFSSSIKKVASLDDDDFSSMDPNRVPEAGEVPQPLTNHRTGPAMSSVFNLPPPAERFSPAAGSSTSTQPGKLPSPTARELSAARLNGMVTEFGFKVKSSILREITGQKKNTSPFDARRYLPMLRPAPKHKEGKPTLILDIDETLVHSSFEPRPGLKYDYKFYVQQGNVGGDVFVAFRPGVHQFLQDVAPYFEVVTFTASVSVYANKVIEVLDPEGTIITDRLSREHCSEVNGNRVKDLSLLGRSLDRLVIIDNSPSAYLFQPRNAIPIESWFEDPRDSELIKLTPILIQLAQTLAGQQTPEKSASGATAGAGLSPSLNSSSSSSTSVYPYLDAYNAHLLTTSRSASLL